MIRPSISVGTKVGPMYVGTRLYPGQSPYGQRAGQTPRQAPRQAPRAYTPTTHSAPNNAWYVARDVRADLAAYGQAQQAQRVAYSQPAAYRAVRPMRRGAGHWLCVALAMVLLALVVLVAVVMVPFVTLPLVALVVLVKIVRTPRGAAVTQHSGNVHAQQGTAGGAVRR